MGQITENDLHEARELLLEIHKEANVGHLGGNLSVIDLIYLLHAEYIRSQDTFILSKGHSAGALYTVMSLMNMITRDELRTFHKNNTRLSGHPPTNSFKNIPFATGSLGHGLSIAAGTALEAKFNKPTKKVFCITSDGEWQEGSTWEALWFSRHHGLDNLTVLIDANGLQGFGSIREISSMDNLEERIKSHGVYCDTIDGHSLIKLREALDLKIKKVPKFLICKTRKGNGLAGFEGLMESHYDPPSADMVFRKVQTKDES